MFSLYRMGHFSQSSFWGHKGEIGDLEEHLQHCTVVYKMVILAASVGRRTLKEHLCLHLGERRPRWSVLCCRIPAIPALNYSSCLITSAPQNCTYWKPDRGGGSIQRSDRNWAAASSLHCTFSIVLLYGNKFSISSRGEERDAADLVTL